MASNSTETTTHTEFDVEALTRRSFELAQASCPGIRDVSEQYSRLLHTLDNVREEADEGRQWGQLYIALACLDGDSFALEYFEHTCIQECRPALASRGLKPSDVDEVLQLLRIRLLIGTGAKLSLYNGVGRLAGFVRTTAIRVALNKIRSESTSKDLVARLADLNDESLEQVDPQLEHLKKGYANAFAEAIAIAWKGLPPNDRLWLRHQLEDHLSIDQLGQLYQMHRSTAARRLATARQHLLDATRDCLKSKMGMGTQDLTSALRLARSRLQIDFTKTRP